MGGGSGTWYLPCQLYLLLKSRWAKFIGQSFFFVLTFAIPIRVFVSVSAAWMDSQHSSELIQSSRLRYTTATIGTQDAYYRKNITAADTVTSNVTIATSKHSDLRYSERIGQNTRNWYLKAANFKQISLYASLCYISLVWPTMSIEYFCQWN